MDLKGCHPALNQWNLTSATSLQLTGIQLPDPVGIWPDFFSNQFQSLTHSDLIHLNWLLRLWRLDAQGQRLRKVYFHQSLRTRTWPLAQVTLWLLRVLTHLKNMYGFTFAIFVLFIPFFVFWSLLATKLREYKNITESLFTFCKARCATQKKTERKSTN